MNKKILSLLVVAIIAFSCSNKQTNDKKENKSEDKTKTEVLQVSKVINQPADFVDKKITVSGMVTHVCRHGGKKLHITESSSDQKLRIKAGEGMSAFERELEGANVKVSGKFIEERIDQEYVDKLRKGETEEHHDHEGDESHQHVDKEKPEDSEKKEESKDRRNAVA